MMNPVNVINDEKPGVSGIVAGVRSALLLFSATFLFACASTGGGSGESRSSASTGGPVAERAIERWEAILAPDFDTAYGYYSPGYRSSKSRGDFELSMRLRKVQFTGAEYQDQECTENACTLTFKTFYNIASPVPGIDTWQGNTLTDEKWIRVDGEWWYFPED